MSVRPAREPIAGRTYPRAARGSRYKQTRRGIAQLDEEGVVGVLHHPDRGGQEPLLAAVGPMQYEVAAYRLEHEFGARVELTPTSHALARRTDAVGAAALAPLRSVEVFQRSDGVRLALFPSKLHLEAVRRDHPDITLDPILVT